MKKFEQPKCTRCAQSDQTVLVVPLHENPEGHAWLQCHRCRLRIGDYLTPEKCEEVLKTWDKSHHADHDDDEPHEKNRKGGHR